MKKIIEFLTGKELLRLVNIVVILGLLVIGFVFVFQSSETKLKNYILFLQVPVITTVILALVSFTFGGSHLKRITENLKKNKEAGDGK